MIKVVGIDVGATYTKAFALDEDKKVIGRSMVKTGFNLAGAAERGYAEVLASAGLAEEEVDYVASTGYGRYVVPRRDLQITELTCHAKGAEYGVYIADGHVKCSEATGILKVIAGGRGKIVNNGASANSYGLYGGWLCPFGNMGEQTCEHSKHPVSNPSRDIASLSCSIEAGCPKQAAFPNE